MDRFLGRQVFDENTQTWTFADGSGRVPDELRQQMILLSECGFPLAALAARWAFAARAKGGGNE